MWVYQLVPLSCLLIRWYESTNIFTYLIQSFGRCCTQESPVLLNLSYLPLLKDIHEIGEYILEQLIKSLAALYSANNFPLVYAILSHPYTPTYYPPSIPFAPRLPLHPPIPSVCKTLQIITQAAVVLLYFRPSGDSIT